MADPGGKRRSCLFVAGLLLALLIMAAVVVYTSRQAPDPASRTPTGAMPPQGEPMRPAGAQGAAPRADER